MRRRGRRERSASGVESHRLSHAPVGHARPNARRVSEQRPNSRRKAEAIGEHLRHLAERCELISERILQHQ
jgi:hypothetical protein